MATILTPTIVDEHNEEPLTAKSKSGSRASSMKRRASKGVKTVKSVEHKGTSYPSSDLHSPYLYLLPLYGAESEHAEYCRDQLLPRIVPALESLLTHAVLENQHHFHIDRHAALKAPDYTSFSNHQDALDAELSHEREEKWYPEAYLPPTPLKVHGTDPLRWLAAELKKHAAGIKRDERKAEQERRRRNHEACSASSFMTTAGSLRGGSMYDT